MKRKLKKKVICISFVLFFLLIGLFILLHFIMADKSLARLTNDADIWDGTVATSFSGGNGTEANPYQIETGSEFAYLQSLLSGTSSASYTNSYYEITNDINLNNIPFTSLPESNIKINGNGNTIANIKITNSLFGIINNGYLKNLNLENVTLTNTESNNYGIILESANNSNFENISLINGIANINGNAAGMAVYLTSSSLNNIYINAKLPNNGYSISYGNDTPVALNKIIANVTYNDTYISSFFNSSVSTDELYYYNGSAFINGSTEYNINSLITMLNASSTSLLWQNYDGNLVYEEEFNEESKFALVSAKYDNFETHESGISNTTAYFNELETDYNYYMGLNYTDTSNNALPDGSNLNKYNEKTLVKVQMSYIGTYKIGNVTYTATTSVSEKTDTYIYYKYYDIKKDSNNNSYIEIELIDNPFANKPTDYAFNGWYTTLNGAKISLDSDYYTRYVKIPISYSQKDDYEYYPNDITINLYASWVRANKQDIKSTSSFQSVINNLDDAGMKALNVKIPKDYDMSGYYYQVSLSRGQSRSGYYDAYGSEYSGWNSGCNSTTCIVYELISNEDYNENTTYYYLNDGYMTLLDNSNLDIEYYYDKYYTSATPMAGYFEKVQVWSGSLDGYYDSLGNNLSGTTASGDYYYKLINYYDNDGNINYYDSTKTYYYLVTRDTNILYMSESYSGSWSNYQTKPLTITSMYNGSDLSGDVIWTIGNRVNLKANADLRIEYIKISSGSTASNTNLSNSTSSSRYFYGNFHNVKFGRGIIQNNSYVNFIGLIGGSNTSSGSSLSNTKFKLIIESGFYSSVGVVSGGISEDNNIYVNAKYVYGNDYDKLNNDNSKLDIYFSACGSWGGSIRSSSNTDIAIDGIIKSGTFGSGKSELSSGIYVGGKYTGVQYISRRVIYEGGYSYNLIGGPLSATTNASINDTYIYVKGGTIDSLFGGAGQTATYGNRIISITDGKINYNVFGGSNGVEGSDGEGTLNGSSFLYIGGSSTIGDETLVNNSSTIWGAEAGSIFGAGNGNADYDTIGSVNTSYIIIDDTAHLLGSIYGGGNYGSASNDEATTVIDIKGGTIDKDIFGASNQNGIGSIDNSAKITINLNGGTVKGNIYGGSNIEGIVYGDINLNLNNGKVINDSFGGGKGSETYINGNININVGSDSTTSLDIENDIYGGSAFGIVNSSTNTSEISEYTTTIKTLNGVVHGSIYGGGKGSEDYTPVVAGNIEIDVEGGNIGTIYGGCNIKGIPNGAVVINAKDGIVGTIFGGGNNTAVNSPIVNINGGTITNVYGGSNNNGDIDKTTINLNSSATNVFGGNNLGGTTLETNIFVNAGKFDYIYGGGNEVTATTTNIEVKGGFTSNMFGAGYSAGATTTNLNVTDGIVDYLYGGSNQDGTVNTSNVNVDKNNTTSLINMDVTYNKELRTWQDSTSKYVITVTIKITNNSDETLSKYNASVQIRESSLFREYTDAVITYDNDTYSFTEKNKYDGTNAISPHSSYSISFEVFSDYEDNDDIVQKSLVGNTDSKVVYVSSNDVINLFGGNNQGGTTTETNVTVKNGNVYNIYGGGNYATSTNNNVTTEGGSTRIIYGGGKEAKTTGNINLDVGVSKIEEFIYGGGDNADVEGTINVNVHGATVGKSIYGGSNTADVNGNITINISDNTKVERSVFGGGNHGKVGKVSTESSTLINLVGATILKNVYGGCNTSVVYGSTSINIGSNVSTVSDLVESDIKINGTIFGGGETNENGDEVYSFDFKSVIGTIDINIDATNYIDNNHNFELLGSIFGSGNASSSKGTSTIYIKNLGTKDNVSNLISIQRSDDVTLDHSVIELSGITDSTNMFSAIPYTFNRINKLTLKDNTVIYADTNTNLLKSFYSETRDGDKATVYINSDGTVLKNVDNRLYTKMNNNFYITTDENATAYGVVSGMTFFGMYTKTGDEFNFGLYDESVEAGDENDSSITGGSYVMGLHNTNHDIKADGFYTNYNGEETVTTNYITPRPPSGTMYMWSIGTKNITYNVYLTATKYSSLGTTVLPMVDFAEGDTIFNVIDFDISNLKSGLWLMDGSEVPKTTTNSWEAETKLGVSMKAETTEWTNHGTTKFIDYYAGHFITGTTTYTTDSQATVPSLMFYLYHAKNIQNDADLGYLTVNLQALTPTSDIDYEVSNITINVHIDVNTKDLGDSYDAAITYGEKYELPSTTTVNITNRSQFTAYYSLLIDGKTKSEIYGTDNSYYHALVTDYVLPVGTKITMLDYGVNSKTPYYYYYQVTESSYSSSYSEYENYGEVAYKLSDFIRMGSTSLENKYDDKTYNNIYYSNNMTYEEFLFIFDFEDTTTSSTEKNNSILFELKNEEGRSKITVLGQRQELMVYNLYNTSNIALEEDVNLDDKYIFNNSDVIFNYATTVNYNKNENFESVIDTNYESSNMGLNIKFYDATNNQITSSLLEDTTFTLNNELYHSYADGIYRIRLAKKVSTLSRTLYAHIGNTLPVGHYKIEFVLFASDDGLFNDGTKETIEDIEIDVLDSGNVILVSNKNDKFAVKEGTEETIEYELTYYQELSNPNLRLTTYLRNKDNYLSSEYNEINITDIFDIDLSSPENKNSLYEKLLTYNEDGKTLVDLPLKKNIKSGTYKLEFKLCNDDFIVDTYDTYIIIKKDLNN